MENKANVDKLNKTINQLERTTQDMIPIAETLKQMDRMHQEIAAAGESVVKMNENFKGTSDTISNNLNTIQSGVKTVEEENLKLYKETQYEVFKSLEKHRSDLQIDIRGEGTQIERTFQNALDKHFLELDKNIKDEFFVSNKKIEDQLLEIDKKMETINQASLRHDKYFKILFGLNALILIAVVCVIFIK